MTAASPVPFAPAADSSAEGGSRKRLADIATLEKLFGDAAEPANPVGRDAVLASDDRAEMLSAGEELLDDFKLNAHFVPEELGGRFTGLPGLIGVMRAVYRRDPCLGLGYGAGSFMAGANVWTAGRETQRIRLAERLLSGSRVACAYHELAHGNDLSRASLTALPGPGGGLLLNGRKEIVANLRRAESMVVFARTDPAAGGRSHSQLLLDTGSLDRRRLRHLERFGTAGMRGVQLGGIEFADCPVPSDSIVGTAGHGVETAMRSFQLTRIALPGMTIGLLDTALRTALRGAQGRRLYGATAADLPLSRVLLAEAFADLLLADVFTTVAARSVHTATAQAGIYASAVKSFVPRLLMGSVYRLSELLGSQFYLRNAEQPLFHKLLRDVQPSAFGHASRVSSQLVLLSQLPLTARRSWRASETSELPPETFRSEAPLPPLDFGRLAVTAGGRDPLARSLANGTAARRICGGAKPEDRITIEARAYAAELDSLAAAAGALRADQLGPAAAPLAFDLVDRWTGVLAAAACLASWWNRPASAAGFGADPAWVRAALHRLGAHLGRHRDPLPAELADPLYAELVRRFDAGLTFDIDGCPTGA